MARGRPSKKQQIVDTALGLFSRLGYQGTSIDQVVNEAGVSKPTVYSNFASKQLLWTHSLDTILQASQTQLNDFLAPMYATGNDIEKQQSLQQILDHWLAIWHLWLADKNRLAIYRIMLGESHKMETKSFELFEQFEAMFATALESILAPLALTKTKVFVLTAISKEALLMPLLYVNSKESNKNIVSKGMTDSELNLVLMELLEE